MKTNRCWLTTIASLVVLTLFSCATRPPMPSGEPLPLSKYIVKYVPKDHTSYSTSKIDPYPPFKMTSAYPGQSPSIIEDEKPKRPYIIIGEMEFQLNWYDNKTIAELIRLHIPKTGADGVLTYHMVQKSAAMMKNPQSGKFRDMYYGTITLELLKYTDI